MGWLGQSVLGGGARDSLSPAGVAGYFSELPGKLGVFSCDLARDGGCGFRLLLGDAAQDSRHGGH